MKHQLIRDRGNTSTYVQATSTNQTSVCFNELNQIPISTPINISYVWGRLTYGSLFCSRNMLTTGKCTYWTFNALVFETS